MNIENKRQIAILLLAVGLGLLVSILLGNHIQNEINAKTAKLAEEYETKKIAPLVRQVEMMNKAMREQEQRLKQFVLNAQQQQQSSQAPSAPTSSLALKTPPGKRAYTVMIDSLSAVGGLINPGDYVDVVAHINPPGEAGAPRSQRATGETISTMVFQNMQILAVDTNLQNPGAYERQQNRDLKVTLAVSPEEAGLLAYVQERGRMKFVLRPPQETETEILPVSNWKSLAEYVFEKQGTELALPREPGRLEAISADQEEAKPFIEVYRGGRL